jgi:hypothetical protein
MGETYRLEDGGTLTTTGDVQPVGDHGMMARLEYRHGGDHDQPALEIVAEVRDGAPVCTEIRLTAGDSGYIRVRDVSCKYFDQKLSVGDPVVVRGSSNEMLGTGKLASDDMDHYPTCILHFDIKGIPAGQAGYTITAGGYQPLIVTEDDLRQEPVGLLTRGAMDVLTGRTDQIKLSR